MKKGSSFFLVFVSGIILILLLFYFLLNSTFAAKLISSTISKSFAGSLHWDKHRISILNGNATVSHFMILDEFGDTVINADTVFAGISIVQLINGNVIIDSGYVKKPQVLLKVKNDSLLNIVSLFKPVKKKVSNKKNNNIPEIDLSKITIKDGLFEYVDSIKNWSIYSEDLTIKGDYNISKTVAAITLYAGYSKYCTSDTFCIDSLKVSGKLLDSSIQDLALLFNYKTDYVNIKGSFSNINDIKKTNGEYEAEVKINTDNYTFITAKKLPYSGPLHLKLNQNGEFNNPRGDIYLNFVNNFKGKKYLNNVTLFMTAVDKEIDIDTLRVSLYDGIKVSSKGNLNLERAFPEGFICDTVFLNQIAYNFNFKINSKLSTKVIRDAVQGRVKQLKGNINIVGRGVVADSIEAKGDIYVSSEFYPAGKLKDQLSINSSFSVDQNIVDIAAKIKSNYTGEGKLTGNYNIKKESLDVDVSNMMFDSEILNNFSNTTFSGIYTINSTVKGPLKNLQAEVYLNGDNINIDTVAIEKMRSVISLDNSSGEIYAHLQAQSEVGFGELKLNTVLFDNNSFKIKKNPQIEGDLSILLSNIGPIVKNGITGDLKIQSNFSGTLNDGIGNSTFHSERIGHEYLEATNLNMLLTYNKGKLNINELTAILPGGKITVDGSINDFKTFSLNSKGSILLDSISKVKEFNTAGLVNFDFHGEGDFKSPIAQLSINVENPVLINQTLDSLNLSGNLIGGAIDFNIYSNFKSYGYYKLEKQEYSIHTTLDSTDFMSFLMPKNQGLWRGMVSGYSYVKGIGSTVDSLILDLYNFNLDYDTLNLATSEALNFFYSGDSIYVKDMKIDLVDSGEINFMGGFSYNGKGDLQGIYKLPYSAFSYITDEIRDGEGYLEGNISASGDIKRPVIKGDFKSDSCSFFISNTEQLLHNLSLSGTFNDTSIMIDSGKMNLESGLFNFGGRISSQARDLDSVNIDMNCEFDKMPITITEKGEFSLSGDVSINTIAGRGNVIGEVKINDGIYYQDLDLNIFSRSKPVKIKKDDPLKSTLFDRIKMDIQLLPYTPVIIDNNISYLEVFPQVKLVGTISKPIVSGRAKVSDGFVTFRNNEFKMKKGFLDFVDPYSNNPNVDIEAEVTIDKWTVTIAIDGNTNDKLNFKLYSYPYLSDREILSLLLIGRPEISGIEDAISVAGEFAGQYLGRTVDRVNTLFSIPVDKVSVSSKDLTSGLTVNIEQDVSKYLSTIYSINMKNGDVSRKAELLLRMFDNFSAKGFTETSGKRGFEVEAGFEKQ